MSNYKDVDKIINELIETKIPVYDKAFSIRDLIGVLEKAPTADVEEIRHGKWDYFENPYGDYFRCSACGMDFVLEVGTPKDNHYQYCPDCGAKMDIKDCENCEMFCCDNCELYEEAKMEGE